MNYLSRIITAGLLFVGATICHATTTTVISASAGSVSVGEGVTISATTSSDGPNLISQAIDYSNDGGNSWTSGSLGAGTRWEGYQQNDTISASFSFPSTGTILFRARGQDETLALSDFQYVSVTIAAGGGGPPATVINASTGSAPAGSSFTVSTTTTANGANLTSQAIDFSTDNGNSWVSGSLADGTRWEGYQPSDTISQTFDFPIAETVIFRARGQDETGTLSDFQYASVTITANTPYAFRVLIDTNTLTATEARNSAFSHFESLSEGAYAITVNSPSLNNSDWMNVFTTLHASQYTITEDLYCDYMFDDPCDWRSRARIPISADYASTLLGRRPDQVMLYHEPGFDSSPDHAYRYPLENTLAANGSLPQEDSHGVLPSGAPQVAGDQISAAHNRSGDSIVALTRAYEPDYRGPYTDAALNNGNCAGILFEMRAPEAGSYDVPAGITHVLQSGKKCYLLLGPSSFTSNTYLTDLKTGLKAILDAGVQIDNPNLFIVLNNYSRNDVSFLGNGSDDPYANPNSVLGAAQWLYRFKHHLESP